MGDAVAYIRYSHKSDSETVMPKQAKQEGQEDVGIEAPRLQKNLSLWTELQTTPPQYTKKFNRSGFSGTAINATYVAMRLTEAFGPCGKGWRMVIENEQIIDGPDGERLHVLRGYLSYSIDNGVNWHNTSPQFGQTKLVQVTKRGTPQQYLTFDEEAPKKSMTDLMSKCASLIGVATDVHLGLYDDNKYVNDLAARFGGVDKTDHVPDDDPLSTDQAVPKLNSLQCEQLTNAIKDAGLTAKAFCAKYKVHAPCDIHPLKFNEAMDEIAAYKAKKTA